MPGVPCPARGQRKVIMLISSALLISLAADMTFLFGTAQSQQIARLSARPSLKAQERGSCGHLGMSAVAGSLALLSVMPAFVSGSRARRSSPSATVLRFFGGDKEEQKDDGELSEAARANIEKLQEEIATLKEHANDKRGAKERLELEVKNFRARTRAELAAARGKAAVPLVKELLPIADEFELAKKNLKIETENQKAIVANFDALYEKMTASWKSLGVEKLQCIGEEFNPELHEAVSMIPSGDYKEDFVCAELRSGWALKAPGSDQVQVLRPSLVCVSAGPGPS
eukprot:TRINITY_DN75774_c0_g1_i1.p1 TRINITY_DN75774_c0_g1~~TRINITY_DN75774_c0_g1_i1.p1  ORF type:complete len:285 (-),score=71.43 TRINITY_DN75774_c0_g1_i1:76-930(-)